MSWQQLFGIIAARRRLACAIAAAVVLAALAASLAMPKVYVATTSVVLDVKSPDPIAGVVLPGLMAPGYMATQVDIISSERVARHVIERLKLAQDETLRTQWQKATTAGLAFDAWLAERLTKNLDVKPSRESNVINISFSAPDAELAARYANAFAASYMDVNLDLKVGPARQYADWFDAQLSSYRERLESAQNALSAYQQKTGVIASEDRVDFETAKLSDLSAQLTLAQTQSADARSRQNSGAGSIAEALQNPIIVQLKSDLARLEAKVGESSQNLGANHPLYRQQSSELAALKARLEAETSRVAGSVAATSLATRQKEAELAAAVAAQKQKVLELKRWRDAISVLRRDVESAQRGFDAVAQRATQTRLEAQSVQTNIAVLTEASRPYRPARPKLLVNLTLAAFMGIFLGVAATLLRELADRRVRCDEDLLLPGLPLVGRIPPATPRGALPTMLMPLTTWGSR